MAKQTINIGTTPDDPTADDIRTSFQKVNSNFSEIYLAGPVSTNVRVIDSKLTTVELDSDLSIIPDGSGKVLIPGVVDAGRVECNILNVETNFNVGEVAATFSDVSNLDVALRLSSDTSECNNLTVNTLTTLNNDVTINLGMGNSLIVTDGLITPVEYFSIDGTNGEVQIANDIKFGRRMRVNLDIDAPELGGALGDLRGDIIYNDDFIYICIADWEDYAGILASEINFGLRYKIESANDSDFTTIGALDNVSGTFFTSYDPTLADPPEPAFDPGNIEGIVSIASTIWKKVELV